MLHLCILSNMIGIFINIEAWGGYFSSQDE